jgi:DNA-binding GntR family transcriptional regulator
VLVGHLNRHSGEAWPSHATLAAELRATKRGVQKGIDQLVDAGHLAVHSGCGRMVTNRYRMILKRANDGSPIQEEILAAAALAVMALLLFAFR